MTDEQAADGFRESHSVQGWLRYSQLHIGLVAVALAGATYSLLDSALNDFVVLLCFCGATVVYVFDRLFSDRADHTNHPRRTRWFEMNRERVTWISRLLAISCLPLLWLLNTDQILLAILLVAVGLGYVIPPRPLRSLGRIKPFLIAAAWTAGVVGLPALEYGTGLCESLMLASYRFVYLVPNTLIADVVDADGDRAAGYETVATNLTIAQLQLAVAACMILAVLIMIAAVSVGLIKPIIILDSLGMLFYLIFARDAISNEKRKFLLDCALLWPLVLFLL